MSLPIGIGCQFVPSHPGTVHMYFWGAVKPAGASNAANLQLSIRRRYWKRQEEALEKCRHCENADNFRKLYNISANFCLVLSILTCFPALIRAVLSGDLRPVNRHRGDLGLNYEAPKGG